MISNMTGILVQPNKAIVGANAYAHSSGIHQDGVLKERSTYEIIDPKTVGIKEQDHSVCPVGRHALKDRLQKLGHTFENLDDFEKVYERFLRVADSKKVVYDEDLEAIVSDGATTVPQTYELEQVQVTCGDHNSPRRPSSCATRPAPSCSTPPATAPWISVYRAINRIVQVPNDLIEYTVQSVTEGISMADVTIRLKAEDMIYTGHAAHTDIVVASAKAYLQALNKQIARVSGRLEPVRQLEHV